MTFFDRIAGNILAGKTLTYLAVRRRPAERQTVELFFGTVTKFIDCVATEAGYKIIWTSPAIEIMDTHLSQRENARLRQNFNILSQSSIAADLVKVSSPDSSLKLTVSLQNTSLEHTVEASLYDGTRGTAFENKSVNRLGSLDQAIHRSRHWLNALKMEFGGNRAERSPLQVLAVVAAQPLINYLYPEPSHRWHPLFHALVETNPKLTPEDKIQERKLFDFMANAFVEANIPLPGTSTPAQPRDAAPAPSLPVKTPDKTCGGLKFTK